jgi:dipeptidyl aminopeptidase/acylaminoacyl peptidase
LRTVELKETEMELSRVTAAMCVLSVAGGLAAGARPAAGAGTERIGSGIKVTENGDPDWSADGRRIAFVRHWQGDSEIWVIRADGTGGRRVTPVGASASEPSWSPDGSRLALALETGSGTDVYTIDVGGARLQRLTTAQGADDSPDWSPDGRTIVFRSRRIGHSQIYEMNADGTEQHRVVTDEDIDLTPAWSPDGTRVAFEGGADNAFIDVVNADGSGRIRLTTFGNEHEPAWSPDGRRIAFSEYSCGCANELAGLADGIWAVPEAGGVPELLVDGSDNTVDSPAWSPNGTRLGYVSDFVGLSQVYVRSVVGGASIRLTGTRPLRTSTHESCTIVGSPQRDVIVGTAKDDVICGVGGDDTIRGLGGDDTLDGGGGQDTIDGGAGDDLLLGGAGLDLLLARGDGGRDRVDGGPGHDRARIDPGDWISFVEQIL